MTLPSTLEHPLVFLCFNIIWTYFAGLITGNISQVDRIWTFLPTIYTSYYALYPLLDSADSTIFDGGVRPRVILMLALQIVWMVRLSYNTWRRGLFSLNEEDYRWAILRKQVPPWLFHIFSLSFVAGAQNVLLFILGLPAHSALLQGPHDLGTSDYVLASLALIALALEFTSDNQQWSYQNFKQKGVISPNEWLGARIQWTEDDRQRGLAWLGFVTRGLWSISRHPNCVCEQSFWYIMTLFPILASSSLPTSTDFAFLWSLLPGLALGALFYGSTIFTESISAGKYPEYAAYQSRVGMFWPHVTVLKSMWLTITGKKVAVERAVWGPVKGKRTE